MIFLTDQRCVEPRHMGRYCERGNERHVTLTKMLRVHARADFMEDDLGLTLEARWRLKRLRATSIDTTDRLAMDLRPRCFMKIPAF